MADTMLGMRGHNEGSIFRRRKTGQWVALVTMRNGKRVSRYAKDRDEAKLQLAELLRLRDAGAPITSRIRLGDYLLRWTQDEHGLAPATRRKHESIARVHLVPRLGHVRLSELSPSDVSRVLAELHRDGLEVQTVRHVRATLRRCLADAVRQGLVTRNAAALAISPRLHHRERTILDAHQARLLIENTKDTRYGPLWTLLVTTGLRISEALGLAWSDVDFGGNDGARAMDDQGATYRGMGGPGRGVTVHLPRAERDVRSGRSGVGGSRGPSITVRHQLARENGEWVRRPPKTAKGRRTIPLTALGVEALRAQRAMQREWMAESFGGEDDTAKVNDGDLSIGVGQPVLLRGASVRMAVRAPSVREGAIEHRTVSPSQNDDARPKQPRAGGDRDGLDTTARNLATGAILGSGDAGNRTRKALAENPQAPHPSERVPRAAVGSRESNRPLRASSPAEYRTSVTPIDGLVFTTSKGHPLHETNVVKYLARDLAEAGLPRVTCHSLRHSCATVLIANGYPIEKVAKILGHTTPRITAEIYMHLTDKDTADSADVMERALG